MSDTATDRGDDTRRAKMDDVGKVILCGMTYLDENDNLIEQQQWVGVVLAVRERGIDVRWQNGTETCLPPQIHDAKPGIYRLRSTGQEVVDPELLSTWVVRPPTSPSATP